jgi:hypothetical protein
MVKVDGIGKPYLVAETSAAYLAIPVSAAEHQSANIRDP